MHRYYDLIGREKLNGVPWGRRTWRRCHPQWGKHRRVPGNAQARGSPPQMAVQDRMLAVIISRLEESPCTDMAAVPFTQFEALVRHSLTAPATERLSIVGNKTSHDHGRGWESGDLNPRCDSSRISAMRRWLVTRHSLNCSDEYKKEMRKNRGYIRAVEEAQATIGTAPNLRWIDWNSQGSLVSTKP